MKASSYSDNAMICRKFVRAKKQFVGTHKDCFIIYIFDKEINLCRSLDFGANGVVVDPYFQQCPIKRREFFNLNKANHNEISEKDLRLILFKTLLKYGEVKPRFAQFLEI